MNTSKQVNVMIGLMFVFLVATLLYFVWDDVRADDAEERQIVENAERGGDLFSLNCRACHGVRGLGIQANPNLPGVALNTDANRPVDDKTREVDLGELMNRQKIISDTIRCGRVGTLMPQWAEDQGGPLNDFQIDQLVALITGAMPGLDVPDDIIAVSELGWEAAAEEADHTDILEGKKLAQAVGPEDTVLVLTDAQGLTVDSLLRIDGEVVKVVDAPVSSSLLAKVSAGDADLPVDRAAELFRSGDIVQVGEERMRVVSASEDTLSVQRAVDGAEAKGHSTGAAVFEPSDEILVERAAFGTEAVAHGEGSQVFAGPIEPPTGPLTGEGQPFGPCGQRGVAAPAPAASPTPTPSEDATPTAGGTTAEIKAIPVIQFDKTELTIAADTDVTITADNAEDVIPHNFAVYTNQDAAESGETALAATEICNGPCIDTATVNLSAGEYFFRCDVHPIQMIGTLTVVAE